MTAYLWWWTAGCAAGFLAGALVLRVREALGLRTLVALGLAWLGLLVGAKLQYRLDHLPVARALALGPADLLDPGMRIPLGFVVGGALAGLWCLAVRAPWRETGDALAVAASVLVPIGRVGCLVNGCCSGTACGPWAAHWCPVWPAGSEAFNAQLRQGVVSLRDAFSLPAHPLPVYFALVSLATLGVLVWLLARRAPAGTLLAVVCVVRPATKLLLEPLRATPRPPLLMVGVPATTLGVTLAVLGTIALRRRAARRGAAAARAGAALGALVVALAAVSPAAAQPAQPLSPEASVQWAKAFAAYLQDPLKHRADLRRLARRYGTDGLPVPFLMALGDMNLRSSRERAAEELFREALDRSPGQPWTGWAQLALGGIATRRGDEAAAREWFEQAAAPDSPVRGMALVTLGAAWARAGETHLALQAFGAVETVPNASPLLRDAARLGVAYTRYWNGDHDGAARAFAAVVRSNPDGPLADDARYGEARARWAAGDHTGARAQLEELAAEGDSSHNRAVSRALVDLRPDAVFRMGFQRYRRSPVKPGDDMVAAGFDGDGIALARAALRLLDPEAPPEAPIVVRDAARGLETTWKDDGGGAAADPGDGAAATPDAAPRAAPAADGPVVPAPGSRVVWIVALLGALAAALLARGGSRRRGRPARR